MDDTSLPLRLGKEIAQAFNQTDALVARDQLDASQATVLQVPQEASPTLLVFLMALSNAQDFAVGSVRQVAHF